MLLASSGSERAWGQIAGMEARTAENVLWYEGSRGRSARCRLESRTPGTFPTVFCVFSQIPGPQHDYKQDPLQTAIIQNDPFWLACTCMLGFFWGKLMHFSSHRTHTLQQSTRWLSAPADDLLVSSSSVPQKSKRSLKM